MQNKHATGTNQPRNDQRGLMVLAIPNYILGNVVRFKITLADNA